MKRTLTFFFFFLVLYSFSQTVPQTINYQGVARHSNGDPISGPIGLRFRIMQGASGPAVFTEAQTVSSNTLGLFSTKIGSVNSLGTINWATGPYFLEVSIDTAGGTSYILMGQQQLVSVPYALYTEKAGSAPDPTLAITNGSVLSVGANTVGLPSSGSPTITGAGAITVSSPGTNQYVVSTPSVTLTGGTTLFGTPIPPGIAQVYGSYPNYSIIVTPTVSYSSASGVLVIESLPGTTPTYSYTANVTQSLSLTGNTLTSGPSTNSVVLPSSGSASLVAGGAVSVATLGTNSYSVSAPAVSITPAGSATVQGTFPSFTISAPAASTTSITGLGAIAVTPPSGNNFTLTVPGTSVGAVSNLTVTSTGTNSFALSGLPPTNIISSNNSATVTATGTNSFDIKVGSSTPVSVTGTNVTVTSPGTNTFNILALPQASVYSSNNSATVTATGTNSFDIKVAGSTPVSVTGTNVTVTSPGTNTFNILALPQASVYSSNNSATVTATGTNSFDIKVPAAAPQVSITGVNGATVTNAYPNFTVDAPAQLSLTANPSGGATISGSYPTLTVNAPAQANITGSGAITVSGTYPNKVISTPSVIVSAGTIVPFFGAVPGGLIQIAGSFPSYSLAVAPQITYNNTTGLLNVGADPNFALLGFTPATYNYTANITPNLSVTSNTIQSGPSTNVVTVKTPAALAFAVSGSASSVGTSGNSLFSTSFNKQAVSSEIDVFVHVQTTTGALSSASKVILEVLVDGVTSAVSAPHVLTGSNQEYVTLRAVFSGLATGSHTVAIQARTDAGTVGFVNLDPNSYGAKLILKETY